jgi:Kef-type K+ transport system membrane component KefB
MEDMIGVILLCITASFIIAELFDRIKLPRMLGGFLVGMTLGLPAIRDFLFSNGSLSAINSFGILGDIFIMFFVGLNIDFQKFKEHSNLNVFFSLLTYLIPFFGGFIIAKILGYGWMVSFLIAGCITLVSEDVPMKIMIHLKLGKSKIMHFLSRMMLGGSLFEVFFLTVIFTYASSLAYPGEFRIWLILAFLFAFIIMLYIARYLIVPFVIKIVEEEHSTRSLFLVSLIVAMFMASLSTYMGLGDNIGALMGGLIIRHILTQGHHKKKLQERDKIDTLLDTTILGFFAPFFFIYIGLKADWSVLMQNPVLGLTITCVAILGKLLVSFVDFIFKKVDFITAFISGIGANSKGAIELIAASIALESGMIGTDVFSAIVLMTFVLSLLSPLLFIYLVKRFRKAIK